MKQDRQDFLSYSFSQSAHVADQGVDLCFGDSLAISWHLALAVHDRIEDALVADSILPSGVGEIAGMFQFALNRFAPPVSAVAGGAVFA